MIFYSTIYNIYKYEWIVPEIQKKIKNQLKNIFNKNTRKIYARKCIVKSVNKEDKKAFLNENHIQGNDRSLYAYGLYYEDKLVSLMTFGKPKFTKKCNWELVRFCSLNGSNVIGGASKLLSYFIKNHCNKGEKIVSYSDFGKSTGKLYSTLGFTYDHLSKPGYVWYKSHKPVISRYKTQMIGEIKKMQGKGYMRIFDSGNKVWIYYV